jgi:organic radical activating enzyme
MGGESYKNPIGIPLLQKILRELSPQSYHSVSFTGGEPLLYTEYIVKAAADLKDLGAKTFLETSGYDPNRLRAAAAAFTYISLDLKLEVAWKELLSVAADFKDKVYLKLVITAAENGMNEAQSIERAGKLLNSHGFNELWIQPIDNSFNLQVVLNWQKKLKTNGVEARFIPQIHKLLGIK